MKGLAVALVVVVVCIVGAGSADAATGTKVFLKDCTLNMSGLPGPGGVPHFDAYDAGNECDQYLLRGISLVTASGREFSGDLDHDDAPTLESLSAHGVEADEFAYGTVDIYIPYRSRCDRYRLEATGAVTRLDTRPCYGESYLNRLVDGPVAGRSTGVLDHPGCDGNFVIQDYAYGEGEPLAQSGNVHVEACADFRSHPFPVSGTFELTSGTGATLRGTVDGTATFEITHTTVHAVYRVGSGTREFRYATGTIDVNAIGVGSPTVGSFAGNYVGSMVETHLRVNDTSVTEGDTGQARMVFRVRLSEARVVPVTVRFAIVDGSASSSSDYVFKQGTLTFAPDETSKVVSVKVNGDTRVERNETLFLELFNSPNARITVPVGSGTILDND